MSDKPVNGRQPAHDRIHAEMLDSFEEELELEVDDDRLDAADQRTHRRPARTASTGKSISRSCSACRKLVKLQSWVQHHKQVVVIFEAGISRRQGGVIKRITQRLIRGSVASQALPGAERARAHAMVFPALRLASAGRRRNRAVLPQLVQPRRASKGSWFCTEQDVEEFFRSVPGIRALLVRSACG